MGTNNQRRGPFMTLPEVPAALGMTKGPGPLPNENIKIILRTNDEQIHCNRFKWYNLPRGIDAQMIERIIYYRGQLAMAVLPDGTFAVLPFCLNGGIDIYGRFTGVSLLPWNGTAEIKKLDDARKSNDQLTRIISAKRYEVLAFMSFMVIARVDFNDPTSILSYRSFSTSYVVFTTFAVVSMPKRSNCTLIVSHSETV